MGLDHTREALLPGSNVGSTEARRDAGVLQLAVEVVLQLRLAVHWQLMSQVLLLSLHQGGIRILSLGWEPLHISMPFEYQKSQNTSLQGRNNT